MPKVDPVRDAAVQVLLRVFEHGAFLDLASDALLSKKQLSERGKRFFTQLVCGTVRHRLLVDHILQRLVTQPLEHLPRPILAILRMAAFQALFCNQVTPPALTHTSVELAKKYGHSGTARLVNAVVRRLPKSLDNVPLPNPRNEPIEFLRTRYSVPTWILEMWIAQLGIEETKQLCQALEEPAPATLRVNTSRIEPKDFLQNLIDEGFPASKETPIPEEVTLLKGSLSIRSKWFREGFCMMQDPAAMLGCHLLEPKSKDLILDICAAPGGKTTHLAEKTGKQARIIAADVHFGRTKLIIQNVLRLNAEGVHVVCANGLTPPFQEKSFDRVLVDAPCSGLGTLRRHPDIKWRLQHEDLENCSTMQERLLRSAISLCKNDGVLVYGVCTFTPAETEKVIDRIIATESVIPEDGPEWLNKWRKKTGIYQTLPHRDNMDGFFWTRLRKQS
ncbi:MAG TPA: 16S rRNA (cytosine(967)-C(5))-methyltransferase RsmB [Candidatus Hydrogenedentes bacterium]|nr:16S rRNA (cytosine(967)-C(5))-methyltransferase RsmB [Candidatus Hydrogenedentota bacterium]HOL75630.1 16S rRNA (cytosine(967)-C(5))-methyltransferase RsmB [Candidatus Hydrogenedentota bacterium]HPO84377.1 16S rRNA (cytosine(967)-C(5))-methyltransferase RsmB [Candidatus Hydrogenedentota bacterium]